MNVKNHFVTKGIIGLLLSACLAQTSIASVISTGTIYNTDAGNTTDYWGFYTSGGALTIDLLAWETKPLSNSLDFILANTVDVNGDGEITLLDTTISIISPLGTTLASNDDDGNGIFSPQGFSDGSEYHYDSFLELTLAAGDYLLAITGFNSPKKCIGGVLGSSGGVGEICGNTANSDHGDYQITWSDNINITSSPISISTTVAVAEPPATVLMLMGLSLAALCSRKRRDKKALNQHLSA